MLRLPKQTKDGAYLIKLINAIVESQSGKKWAFIYINKCLFSNTDKSHYSSISLNDLLIFENAR